VIFIYKKVLDRKDKIPINFCALKKMVLIDVGSFEIGLALAQILRSIAYDIFTKPSISAELLQFEQRFKQLKEDICSNNVVDCDKVILTIQDIFCELQVLINSSQNEQ